MLCRRSSLRFPASLFSAFAKHRFSKPLRYLTNLVLAKPFHRKSRHFFSLPCQCIRSKTLPQRIVTVHHFSFANHISAFLCHSFASPCSAPPLPCLSVLLSAAAPPCFAVLRHCTAAHLIAFALHRRALPLPSLASQSHRTANRTQPCHCFALPISAPHGRAEPLRCGAMRTMPFLRESGPSMPCPCAQSFTS